MMEYLFLQTSFAETKGMHTVCLKNLGVLQSVDIPWTGDFAAECHGQTVLFLNKEETQYAKGRLEMRHLFIHVRNVFMWGIS